eukprot:jgi/Botrbrau1/15685/Bobra.4_1s0063.1
MGLDGGDQPGNRKPGGCWGQGSPWEALAGEEGNLMHQGDSSNRCPRGLDGGDQPRNRNPGGYWGQGSPWEALAGEEGNLMHQGDSSGRVLTSTGWLKSTII